MGRLDKLYKTDVPHRAKLVYIYLHDRMDKERKAWPGLNTIASHLSLSRSTVKRAVKDLEKAAPIDTICCEPKKTNLVRQGRTMPKQWTEGRFILRIQQKEKTQTICCYSSVNVFLIKYFDKSN